MNQVTKNTLTTVGGAFVLISFVNIISRGLGFFREVLFANYFGVNVEFDVYLVGAAIPVTLNTIILYIGQNYFIPAFNKNRLTNHFTESSFTALHLVLGFFVGFLLAAFLYLFSSSFVSIFIDNKNLILFETAKNIFQIFLISIPLTAIISIIVARQQAELSFKHPALSKLLLNLTIIPVLLLFTDEIGIYTIPIGFVVGILLQLIYLSIKSKKLISLKKTKYSSVASFKGLIDSTLIGVLIIEAIGQLYLLVDRYFFDQVQEGGISALNYASNLNLLPVSIFAVALATVVFPKLSETISQNKLNEFNELLNDSFKAILFIFIPATIIYFFYGDSIIKLLFQRGEFTDKGTEITFSALKYYSLSLVFYSAYSILNKTFYAARLVKYLIVITIIGIFIKVLLNIYFVRIINQDGLALATSFSYFFFFLSSLLVINYKYKLFKPIIFIRELVFLLLVGLCALVFTNMAESILQLNIVLLELTIFLFLFLVILFTLNYSLPVLFKDFKNRLLFIFK